MQLSVPRFGVVRFDGYAVVEVDDLIDRIESALASRRGDGHHHG